MSKVLPAFVALALALSSPAKADLVIQGQDAQKLHCAAMLLVVAGVLQSAGQLTDADRTNSAVLASGFLLQLPGTDRQRLQAVQQRADKIIRSRSLNALAQEFSSTAKWCSQNAQP